MILSAIRDFLRMHGQASLADIARQVNADPEAVRAMVEVWVKKGQATRLLMSNKCGTHCRQCDSAQMEIYIWNDPRYTSRDVPNCDRC